MTTTREALALIAAATVLCALGCGKSDETEPASPATVRTARAGPATIVERVRLSGRVVPPPDRDATLAPLVPGRLASIDVRQGERVKKGQVLARVETASLDDVVGAAEAASRREASEMEFRRRVAERTRALYEKGVSSREDAEADEAAAVTAVSAHAQAQSALAEAHRRRQWADVTAPFDGVVLRVIRSAGEQVDGTPATPVVEVAAPVPAEVAADAPADALGRISAGNEAEVVVAGTAESTFAARVASAARAVDPATGVGEVRLALADPSLPLLLGAAVEVRIEVSKRQAATTVPASALRRSADGATEVVVVEAGKARARAVKTGIVDQEKVEILSGLSGGEEVVVDDPVGLVDGTPLKAGP